MGWQGRDSRRYFYLARRRNGRQENVYIGKGPVAELAAAKLEEDKSRRIQVRNEIRTARDELRALDSLIATVDQGVARLLEATLLGQGYYRDAIVDGGVHDVSEHFQVTDEPPVVEDLNSLVKRARKGDETVLPQLREMLDTRPELWQHFGNLAVHAREAWLRVISADDLALRESTARKAEDLARAGRT